MSSRIVQLAIMATTTTPDKASPQGTTDVHASRVCTSMLKVAKIKAAIIPSAKGLCRSVEEWRSKRQHFDECDGERCITRDDAGGYEPVGEINPNDIGRSPISDIRCERAEEARGRKSHERRIKRAPNNSHSRTKSLRAICANRAISTPDNVRLSNEFHAWRSEPCGFFYKCSMLASRLFRC